MSHDEHVKKKKRSHYFYCKRTSVYLSFQNRVTRSDSFVLCHFFSPNKMTFHLLPFHRYTLILASIIAWCFCTINHTFSFFYSLFPIRITIQTNVDYKHFLCVITCNWYLSCFLPSINPQLRWQANDFGYLLFFYNLIDTVSWKKNYQRANLTNMQCISF